MKQTTAKAAKVFADAKTWTRHMPQSILLSAFLLFFGFVAAAESPEEPESSPSFSGEITIGATFPLSGFLESYGQSAYYGATTRVRMINAVGGVNGKKLNLEWRDNRSDPVQAVLDVRELAGKHKVPAVLGPLLSEAAMSVRPTARQLGVVIMSPLATADATTRGNPWMFRACYKNTDIAEGMALFQIRSYGAKTCGILYDPRYVFSRELADIFEKIFEKHGGKVLGKQRITNSEGRKAYQTPLLLLASEKPDFIFAASYALEATEIVRAARDLGINTRFCGPDTWDNELVFDASGTPLINTSIASSLFEQAFSYRPFQDFFNAMEQAGMDNPDAQAACAYDAVTLLAKALEEGETPEAIRDALHRFKRLPTATGRITITKDGDAIKPVLIRIVERQGGRLVPVYAERYDP